MEKVPINIDHFTPPLSDLLSEILLFVVPNSEIRFSTLVQHKEMVPPLEKEKAPGVLLVGGDTRVSPTTGSFVVKSTKLLFFFTTCEASQQMSPWTLHITVG